jgi:hypothetical protein
MDRYHVALFVHLLALVVAAGASAVVKLAAGRGRRARTVGEVLDWHDTTAAAARLFPVCLAVFVVTGAYMLSFHRAGAWLDGWVVAGLAGSALLLASGAYLGIRGGAQRAALAAMAAQGADQVAPRLVPPPLVAALSEMNGCVALAVVFAMVTKPASVAAGLGLVALGAAVGAAIGLRGLARTPDVDAAAAAESAPAL